MQFWGFQGSVLDSTTNSTKILQQNFWLGFATEQQYTKKEDLGWASIFELKEDVVLSMYYLGKKFASLVF